MSQSITGLHTTHYATMHHIRSPFLDGSVHLHLHTQTTNEKYVYCLCILHSLVRFFHFTVGLILNIRIQWMIGRSWQWRTKHKVHKCGQQILIYSFLHIYKHSFYEMFEQWTVNRAIKIGIFLYRFFFICLAPYPFAPYRIQFPSVWMQIYTGQVFFFFFYYFITKPSKSSCRCVSHEHAYVFERINNNNSLLADILYALKLCLGWRSKRRKNHCCRRHIWYHHYYNRRFMGPGIVRFWCLIFW